MKIFKKVSGESENYNLTSELLAAAQKDDIQLVRKLISAGANVNGCSEDGWTSLLEASINSKELVQELLSKGADPNIASDRGYTPLMRAAGNGKMEIVEMLVAAGADMRAKDIEDQTANDIAMHEEQYETSNLLEKLLADAIIKELMPSAIKRGMTILPLDSTIRGLIFMTRNTVGGRVNRLDIRFSDGTQLKGVKVIEELVIEIPAEYVDKEIKSTSVPFKQD